jgi:hypothetical protein
MTDDTELSRKIATAIAAALKPLAAEMESRRVVLDIIIDAGTYTFHDRTIDLSSAGAETFFKGQLVAADPTAALQSLAAAARAYGARVAIVEDGADILPAGLREVEPPRRVSTAANIFDIPGRMGACRPGFSCKRLIAEAEPDCDRHGPGKSTGLWLRAGPAESRQKATPPVMSRRRTRTFRR